LLEITGVATQRLRNQPAGTETIRAILRLV